MKNRSKKIFIIDIGSHQMEELDLMFKPNLHQSFLLLKWSLKQVISFLRSKDISRINRCISTIKLFFKSRKNLDSENIFITSVEPNFLVCVKQLIKWRKISNFSFYPSAILGHDLNESVKLIDLNLYENSISSSLYQKNGLTIVSKSSCIGVNFNIFINAFIEKNKILPTDEIILRINCEGSELAIVQSISEKKLNISMIIGSLNDVQKIHGQIYYDKMISILNKNQIPFLYVKGSTPNTWPSFLSNPKISSLIYKK